LSLILSKKSKKSSIGIRKLLNKQVINKYQLRFDVPGDLANEQFRGEKVVI